MTVTTVINGKIKIVLTPENEIEKAILKMFASSRELSTEQATDNFLVMNRQMPDSLIFTNEATAINQGA